jgi:hypothetical protein
VYAFAIDGLMRSVVDVKKALHAIETLLESTQYLTDQYANITSFGYFRDRVRH